MEEAIVPESPADWGAVAADEDPSSWGAVPVQEKELTYLQKLLQSILKAKLPGNSLGAAAVRSMPVGGLVSDPISGDVSAEQALENLPAVGAVVGTTLTGGNLGAGGILAGGGESARQIVRHAAGMPQATGLVQRMMDLKPDSIEASVAGLVAEMGAVPVAVKVSQAVLTKLAEALNNAGLRTLAKNLLRPTTAMDKRDVIDTAERMRSEGIAGVSTTRAEQIRRADAALKQATADLDAEKARIVAAGGQVPIDPIITPPGKPPIRGPREVAAANIPALIKTPAGPVVTPETGSAQRAAAEKVMRDTVQETGGAAQVPFEHAMAAKERGDELLRGFYTRGQVTEAESLRPTKNVVDSWRAAIYEAFPDAGDLLARKSDLITIKELLEESLKHARATGAEKGWWYNPAAAVRSIMHLGPASSLTSAGQTLLSKVLDGGAKSVQIWMRLADQFNAEASKRPEDKAIEELAKSIQAKPAVTEEEFIRRYQ